MRKLVLITSLMLIAVMANAQATIDGNDKKVTYIGRTVSSNGATSFDWSGVTCIVDFEGTYLKMVALDTTSNSFNVWVDNEVSPSADRIVKLNGNNTIVSGLRKGHHTVILQKRTEGEQGLTTIKEFSTDGKFLQARSLKQRRIEFIGDSFTCGYGTESLNREEPFKAETENCNLTYAAIIGRFFDADIQLISHSGRGVVRNYGGGSPDEVIPNKYLRSYDCTDGPEWKNGKFNPNIVVIYLGTNDFSLGVQPSLSSWCSEYKRLLTSVRDNYPNVPVLCVAARTDDALGEYVKAAVENSGLKNVYWTSIQEKVHNDTDEMGASDHPKYEGHRKVASLIIPYISTIAGWEMPHKVIE